MTLLFLLRLIVLIVCAVSFSIMLIGFVKHRHDWNAKTRDYWYGRVMWTVVGMSSSIEGLIRHTQFRYTIVFILAAAFVTLKGNLQKGSWGNRDEK